MDPPAAATIATIGNGSHQPHVVSARSEGAGVGGSLGDGQQQYGTVASSQCKIAAAHIAQIGEMHRSCRLYPCRKIRGLAVPGPKINTLRR